MGEKQEPPLWLDAVRKFERAQSQVTGAVENVTDDVFRMFNIPAGSDVRKLREQLSRMERRLESMSKELAKRDDAPPSDATKAPPDATKAPLGRTKRTK